jgi:hypothetical protein
MIVFVRIITYFFGRFGNAAGRLPRNEPDGPPPLGAIRIFPPKKTDPRPGPSYHPRPGFPAGVKSPTVMFPGALC